jgi:hypothetical protein
LRCVLQMFQSSPLWREPRDWAEIINPN